MRLNYKVHRLIVLELLLVMSDAAGIAIINIDIGALS